jgi:hypothetical protein
MSRRHSRDFTLGAFFFIGTPLVAVADPTDAVG